MSGTAGDASGVEGGERRRELARVIARLEGELAKTEAALIALGPEGLPGLHLVVEVAGHRAILPGGRVRTVVPLVATQPVLDAPRDVLGAFVLRGAPVTVLDVARCLGTDREPSLDAPIIVLGGARAVGVLVDRVLAVEDRAELVQRAAPRDEGGPWAGARLVAGLCRWRDQVLPLLDVASLVRRVEDPAR